MLVKQELVSKIKDYFNLNSYETKVWLALLGKGTASAGEIAEISGVPRSRTYDVLESLEKKGFSIVKIGKPVKYIGVKPRMILEKLKNDVRRHAEERIIGLSNIKNTEEFTELEQLYRTRIDSVKGADITAALQGRLNISNHLKEILQNANKEVIICTAAIEVKAKLKLFQQTFAILNKSNVKISIVLSGEDALIKQLEKVFEMKIKKTNIDTKFFIIDRKEVLFYLSKGDENKDVAIWLNSEFFAKAFAALFEKALGVK